MTTVRPLMPLQQQASDVATTRAPWVLGYINAVLTDLDDALGSIPRLRAVMPPDWDPLPTYEFHIALAQARIRALHPIPGGGVATTPTPPPVTPKEHS
jgi:hypothetical protein